MKNGTRYKTPTNGAAASKYDQEYFLINEAAEELQINLKLMRSYVKFDHELGRPADDSLFPYSFKEGPGKTSRIRVLKSDVTRYKAAALQGNFDSLPIPFADRFSG